MDQDLFVNLGETLDLGIDEGVGGRSEVELLVERRWEVEAEQVGGEESADPGQV